MSTYTGLPDFGRPVRVGVTSGYAVFEQPQVLAAIPTGLSPAPLDGATGPLSVDVYLQERDGGVSEFSVVTAGFTVDVPLDTGTGEDSPELVARPAPLAEGMLRLVAPTDLGVPSAVLAPQPFDAAAGRALPLMVRLDGVAGELLVGALRAGLLALGAVACVTVRGLATRCPGTLSVDVDALLAGLGPGPFTADDLMDRAVDGLPGVTVPGGPDDPRLRAAAVLDRVVTRLATPAFGDGVDGGDDSGWRFPGTWGGQTTLTWDLSEPSAARRLLRLTCDAVVASDSNENSVRRHTAPPLTDGHERVVVHTTMPAMPAGVVLATARLTAPPDPPDRPFAAEVTARLEPPAPTEVTLVLAPGEPLVYDLAGTAVIDTDQGPRAVVGRPRRVDRDPTPVVTPADLGLRLIPVNATDGLLDLADVAVSAGALWSGARVDCRAQLPAGSGGRAWLALPRDAEDVTIKAHATPRGAGAVTVEQALPDAAVWLDPFSFDDPPWPLPGDTAKQPVVVEAAGLRVVGFRGGSDWRFLPVTAGPVRDGTGAPQLSLLEMAGTAMLMVTTSLLASDAQQDAARAACIAAGAAADARLIPAPFEAEEAALLVRRAGELALLVATVPSGTTTQDAAFGVSLGAADLDTVHRALAGEAGLFAVRYLLRVVASGPEAAALGGGPGPVPVLSDASTWRT